MLDFKIFILKMFVIEVVFFEVFDVVFEFCNFVFIIVCYFFLYCGYFDLLEKKNKEYLFVKSVNV